MGHFIEDLQPNDHAALVYRSRVEQFEVVIPYIKVGLARNERCLYIASDNPVRIVIEAMEGEGIDVERETREGRLLVASPTETYLKSGIFEPKAMVDGLDAEVKRAIAEGFNAYRAAGELAWALLFPSALIQIYQYEAMLDSRFPNAFVALCQYNENAFSPEIISQMLRVHPKIVTRGRLYNNPFYVPHGRSLDQKLSPVGIEDLVVAAG